MTEAQLLLCHTHKLFDKVSSWLFRQNVIGITNINEDVYRKDGVVIRFCITNGVAELKCFGNNTTIAMSEGKTEIITEKSAKDTVVFAALLADKWSYIKGRINSVIKKEQVKIDKSFEDLDARTALKILQCINNRNNW